MNNELEVELASRVEAAYRNKSPLKISAGNSKAFYGNQVDGEALDVAGHTGIIEYQPSELVITARSGTKLAEIEDALAANKQMLAFEPPMHSADATLGGAVAAGLSGPRRAFSGAVRDFVLGTRIINGKGEILKFGGQVMKNVAGYDVSRLMAGAQGTLGVLLDISLKVLPRPQAEATLALECDAIRAQRMLQAWIGRGLPLTASCYHDGLLQVRLGNTANSVTAAAQHIGGESADDAIWQSLRNQQHDVFKRQHLWRLSLPPAAEHIGDITLLVEWAGGLRWAVSEQPLHDIASRHGGHATRYDLDGGQHGDCFQPLPGPMLALQKRIKQAFDPGHVLNPGRIYREL